MKAVLGDERYAKSQQLDDAFTSGNLRHELAKANPTEAQFEELFKLETEWNKALSDLDRLSPDYLQKLKALNEARDQEHQRVLGADAYNNLQKQQDSTYVTMKKNETLWGLDDAKIDYAYKVMKAYEQGVKDYRSQVLALQASGESVDRDAVNRSLQQFAEQTREALQNHLGPDSFNKLQRNQVFRWVVLPPQPFNNGSGHMQ
jgi:hypothetical protein